MDKCREAFEAWFRTTKAYQMLEEQNYFKMDLFHFVDGRDEYRHTSVQIAFMTWQSRQAEVDEYKMVSESIEDLYLLERKKVKAVEQVLIDLKESMTNFKEMDLYDKGVRNTTVYAIKDLEKALRGEHE